MVNRTVSSALMLATLAAAQETKPQCDEQAYQAYRAGERNAEAIVAEYQAQHAYPSYRAGERASYEPAAQPKSLWQWAGEWLQQKVVQPVQQAVPKIQAHIDNGLRWIDQHQPQTALAVGIGVGLTAAAIVLTGGLAAPIAMGLAIGVAGLTVGAGTVGLNAYFGRPLGTNVLRNAGYAAGAAAVTLGAVIGGSLLVQHGIVQQGFYAAGNAATRLCVTYPAGCARVSAALTLWDKVEDIGLQAKLALQTARGDPRAAETALELQLERQDNTPGNTTFREAYDAFVDAFRRHGDEVAQLSAVALRHSEDVAEVAEDGMVYLRRGSEAAEEVAQEIADATGRPVWVSPSRGAIYVSRPTEEGLEAATKLRAAVQSGADEAAIQELIEDVARASTRGRGERVVLGAWQAGGGYIGEAVENGGVFFDTGDEVWQMLKASGVDPWDVNEQFLRNQLESGVERIDFVREDIFAVINHSDLSIRNSFRAKEIRYLLENAERYGYERVGNSWILKRKP